LSISHLYAAYWLIGERRAIIRSRERKYPGSKFPFTSRDCLVLERMALFARRGDGVYDRGFQAIASVLDCSTKTVERAAKNLQALGFIAKLRNAGGPTYENGERNTTSEWKVMWAIAELPDKFRMKDQGWTIRLGGPEVNVDR
jgi:hypothetical protein